MSGKELFLTISPSNPDPMYRQITEQIKDAIAAGEVLPGDQLPSIREMAQMLNISAITIKRAYQDLESEGFIMTRAGLGSYIAEKNPQEIRLGKLREIRKQISAIVETGRRYGITKTEIKEIFNEEMK
jgi:GntR family transcriptional regulator